MVPDFEPPVQVDLTVTLPAEARSSGLARRYIRDWCTAAGVGADIRETAALLTSELVTNAVLHGRSEVRMEIAHPGALVRVSVSDENSRHPQPQEIDDDALDGRGLQIVELLASAWGVTDSAMGKTVWFELSLAP